MGQDSIHALWVDPLAFDAMENGPPYLPETTRVVTARTDFVGMLLPRFEGLPMVELGVLVGILRAASIVHQTHHWQTQGSSSYGDHLLFDRLYSDSVGFIDSVAERAVGSGGRNLVCPKTQSALVRDLIDYWCQSGAELNPHVMVAVSLTIERSVLEFIKTIKARLSAQDQLSEGTDNLLQGVADKHEEFVYLLQQRVREASSRYDFRGESR